MLDSPLRLTVVVIVCAIISAVMFSSISLLPSRPSATILAICLALVVVCLIGALWASSKLHDCVQNERWPEKDLEPLRALFLNKASNIISVLLVLAMISVLVFTRHSHGNFWSINVLLQAQTQLMRALRRSVRPMPADQLIDWSQNAPLHSEHWGELPASSSPAHG